MERMMHTIRSFFLVSILSTPFLVAQSEQDIEKRIEGLNFSGERLELRTGCTGGRPTGDGPPTLL